MASIWAISDLGAHVLDRWPRRSGRRRRSSRARQDRRAPPRSGRGPSAPGRFASRATSFAVAPSASSNCVEVAIDLTMVGFEQTDGVRRHRAGRRGRPSRPGGAARGLRFLAGCHRPTPSLTPNTTRRLPLRAAIPFPGSKSQSAHKVPATVGAEGWPSAANEARVESDWWRPLPGTAEAQRN